MALPPASVMDRFSSAEGLAAARAEAAALAAARDSDASSSAAEARPRADADDSNSHRDDASSDRESPGHPRRHMAT